MRRARAHDRVHTTHTHTRDRCYVNFTITRAVLLCCSCVRVFVRERARSHIDSRKATHLLGVCACVCADDDVVCVVYRARRRRRLLRRWPSSSSSSLATDHRPIAVDFPVHRAPVCFVACACPLGKFASLLLIRVALGQTVFRSYPSPPPKPQRL